MSTYFEGTTRRATCDNVIGTGKRAYHGGQMVHSNTMNPHVGKETGAASPSSSTAAAWGGVGSDSSTAI